MQRSFLPALVLFMSPGVAFAQGSPQPVVSVTSAPAEGGGADTPSPAPATPASPASPAPATPASPALTPQALPSIHIEPIASPVPRHPVAGSSEASPAQPTAPSRSRAGRIALEMLAGITGGALLGVGGGALGYVIGSAIGGCSGSLLSGGSFGCLYGIVIGGVLGSSLGIPLSVYGAGYAMDGNGNFWATLLGEVAGVGVGLLTIAAPPLAIAGVFMPFIGAVLGYELSSDDSREEAERRERNRARTGRGTLLLPALASLPGGGMVGLGGVF